MSKQWMTGLCLELPASPLTGRILALREKYDAVRVRRPIEITLVGSSGLGWFDSGHSAAQLQTALTAALATESAPRVSFTAVRHFDGTGLYWLEPSCPEQYRRLQLVIGNCGLGFLPTEFPFTPHCTIVNLAPQAGADAVADVRSLQYDDAVSVVACASVHAIDAAGAAHRLFTVPFSC